MKNKYFSNPFFFLLPFLVGYIAYVLLFSKNILIGDEERYLTFASNLLHGFYSPPPPAINLWNGPGYPLFLLPFLFLHSSLLVIKLSNAFLYYFSLILFFKTTSKICSHRKAIVFTILLGCYWMALREIKYVLTETFTIFILSSIVYYSFLVFSGSGNRKNKIMLGFLIAVLLLTKVMFAYALLVVLGLYIILQWKKPVVERKTAIQVMLFAFLFCAPYLIYTYSLTGKLFYWSNAGGMSLYWMSNPNAGEFGEWQNDSLDNSKAAPMALEMYKLHHQKIYDDIYQYSGIERDQKFREYAWKNIHAHPAKFLQNWFANWGRIFFDFPYGYFPQQIGTIGNLFLNSFIFVLCVLLAIPAFMHWEKIPFAIRFVLTLSVVYLFGSSFLSAYARMFYILIPIILSWFAFMFGNIIFIYKQEA